MKTAKIDKMNEKDLKWMKVDEKYCQSNDFKSSSSYHIISYHILSYALAISLRAQARGWGVWTFVVNTAGLKLIYILLLTKYMSELIEILLDNRSKAGCDIVPLCGDHISPGADVRQIACSAVHSCR